MLNGPRIILGPILPSDFPNLFMWADDLDAARVNENYRPAIWRNQEDFWLNVGNDPSRVYFAIRKRPEPQIIGFLQIWNIDPVHRSCVLGLRIGDVANRGQGLGAEALEMGEQYCWNHLNLSRISLMVFATNLAAIKLYTKHGFVQEGCLRQAVFIDGKWLDVLLMGKVHPSRTDL